ncbi:MAG TPA: glycoside hydrolase family 99-like domain-containing protein [Casimicrobiaceae bacterium]
MVSRNASCPCGSGRRFKDCHGALSASASTDQEQVASTLARALAAQRDGRLADAIAAYDQALAVDPRNFNALHMQGVAHFQRGEFEIAGGLIDRALAVDPSASAARFNRRLVQAALERRFVVDELAQEAAKFAARMSCPDSTGHDRLARVIAFYLPQYHRIRENDAWWGEGFTEWTNVRKAFPNFSGHWQPHVPADLGYYDLTDPDVRIAQAALARTHGIDAFCYYYYWFAGRRLLESPLNAVLESGQPDFPFCVCWANENWTRRWDGRDDEILMAQRYDRDDARAFITDLLPLFRDPRYVRIDGRPLLVVYRIGDIPNVRAAVEIWRATSLAAGTGDPYLCAVQWHPEDDPTRSGFDAAIEFPPIGHAAENLTSRTVFTNPRFRGMVFDYRNLVAHYLMLPRPPFPQFRGATPMWDNTPRRQDDAMIVADSSPEVFGVWLERIVRQTMLRHHGDERLVFVNAWNEWAEGNHLEPDARHGRRYLQAVRTARRVEFQEKATRPSLTRMVADVTALAQSSALAIERWGSIRHRDAVQVSVVMPIYNHARFLERALGSLLAQTRRPNELVAVDDGSSDDSAAIVAAFGRRAPFAVTLVRQANAGAHEALNHGIALAEGDVLAFINSDDCYMPERLARLTAALGTGVELAFSDVQLIDDDDAPALGTYASELRARIDAAAAMEDLLRPLMLHNVATSTGNLVCRRTLVGAIGGFAPFVICHDWDFLLAATYATRFAFVREPLYAYRLHDANTFADRRLLGRLEGDEVLQRFFARIDVHPWLDSDSRADLLSFIRNTGLSGYLPQRKHESRA